jgi:hypothetical protein
VGHAVRTGPEMRYAPPEKLNGRGHLEWLLDKDGKFSSTQGPVKTMNLRVPTYLHAS